MPAAPTSRLREPRDIRATKPEKVSTSSKVVALLSHASLKICRDFGISIFSQRNCRNTGRYFSHDAAHTGTHQNVWRLCFGKEMHMKKLLASTPLVALWWASPAVAQDPESTVT